MKEEKGVRGKVRGGEGRRGRVRKKRGKGRMRENKGKEKLESREKERMG